LCAIAPQSADALGVVQVRWTESGSDAIVASPGDVITAEIHVTAGAEGISSYGISIEFDDDLDFVSATELLPGAFAFNLDTGVTNEESSAGTPGHVFTFEAATFDAGAVSQSFLAGTIQFQVVAPLVDGPDVVAGLFNAGVDGVFDSEGLVVETVFGGASVTPEPGSVLLLGAGLAALSRARGRRR
jgi:hypothetical protein